MSHPAAEDGQAPPESPIERTAFRKISRRLIPFTLLAFLVTYIDRANIGVAATDIQKTLHLTPTAFGLAAGLFYVGYLILEIPSNLLLERFGARRWIARILVSFGLISAATALVWNDMSLIVVRILLGLAEAGMYPGLLLYLGYWFSKRRRSANWLIFQISLPLGLAVGSLVSSSLLALDGVAGLHGWQWIFLAEGAITIVFGIVFLLSVPDRPKDAKWLTSEERTAVEAVTDISAEREVHSWVAIRKVLLSPVSWFLIVMFFCTLTGFLTVNYWAPTIIGKRFALGPVASGFLSVIPWVVSALSLIVAALIAKRVNRPALIIFVSMVLCGIGITVASLVANPVIAFVGLCLATVQQAAVPMVFVFVRGYFPLGMAAVAFAWVNAVSNLAGLVGPTLFGRFVEVTGSTQGGLLALSGFFWLAALMALATPGFIRRQQRRKPGYFGPAAGMTVRGVQPQAG